MSAVPTINKRELPTASSAPARHSGEGRNLPTSSFRTPRSGDPESSSLPSAVEHGVDDAQVQTKMGWPMVRLGDVAKTSSGGTPKRSVSSYYDGDIPWVKSGELGDRIVYETEERISQAALEQSSAKLFPKGTLCVALYGATVGKLGILGIGAATNQAVCGIFLPESIDTRFAYRFLESKRRELIEKGKGGAQPNISQEIIRDLEFPLPVIGVQHQIVAEIEKQFTRLDAGVAALRRAQANLRRYRAAVLKVACEGRLVPTEAELAKAEGRNYETGEQLLVRILADRRKNWHGRGKYKEPAAPDTTNLTLLPEGWRTASVDQLCGHITSGSRDWSKFYGRGKGTFILAQNVRPMRLDLTERQAVDAPEGDAETERTRVRRDDILVTIVGAKTGDVCRIPIDLDEHFVCQSVAIIRPLITESAKFIEMYLASQENGQEQWKRYIYGQGRPHLSFEQLKATAIQLPPLAEQARIVAEVERRLSVIEELEAAVNANLRRAGRLRNSILRKAFSN